MVPPQVVSIQNASRSGAQKVGLTTVEVFLQMCCFVTSIFERPRLFLCLQHTLIQNIIYTQNSEEPLIASVLTQIVKASLFDASEAFTILLEDSSRVEHQVL